MNCSRAKIVNSINQQNEQDRRRTRLAATRGEFRLINYAHAALCIYHEAIHAIPTPTKRNFRQGTREMLSNVRGNADLFGTHLVLRNTPRTSIEIPRLDRRKLAGLPYEHLTRLIRSNTAIRSKDFRCTLPQPPLLSFSLFPSLSLSLSNICTTTTILPSSRWKSSKWPYREYPGN